MNDELIFGGMLISVAGIIIDVSMVSYLGIIIILFGMFWSSLNPSEHGVEK